MSPEKTAWALWRRIRDQGPWTNDEAVVLIAHAVRKAENAALERAAKHIVDIYPNCLAVTESVRSLKSRAPKRKAGRA